MAFTFSEKQLELSRKLSDLQRKTVINTVKGNMSPRKAYYAAGGKAKSDRVADSALCTMLTKVNVKAFYDSLIEEVAGESILSRDEAMVILTDIARAKVTDIADFSTITLEDGQGNKKKQSIWSFKDSDSISEKSARVVSEVSVGKDGLKFKTHSQTDAIKQLRALEGWDKPVKHEHGGADGGPIKVEDVSNSDLARRIAFMLTKGTSPEKEQE